MKSALNVLPGLIVLVFWLCCPTTFSQSTGSYEDTRKLLAEIKDYKNDSDKLRYLFSVGDSRIDDLLKALDDPDPEIGLRSQVIIRYLGNRKGMTGLFEWYQRKKTFQVAGPVPLPLRDWDYKVIESQFLSEPVGHWTHSEPYIYALALDDSLHANRTLAELVESISKASDVNQSVAGRSLRNIRSDRFVKSFAAKKDLAKAVLDNAFFISPEDKKYASSKLLGLNGFKDKALIQIELNRGILSSEFYHVVIELNQSVWRFFSITQVAVS